MSDTDEFGTVDDHKSYTQKALALRFQPREDADKPTTPASMLRWVREKILKRGCPHRVVGRIVLINGRDFNRWVQGGDDDECETGPSQ